MRDSISVAALFGSLFALPLIAACGSGGEGDPSVLTSAVTDQDITTSGTAIALITNPTGGGNHSLAVIHDGVMPPVSSTDASKQYDTYAGGGARAEDWIGYSFSSAQSFSKVVFQEGKQFSDGGWFASLKVQTRQNGVWVDAPALSVSPAYPANNGIGFETFTLTFPSVTGDAIRIDGAPGGTARFISVGELRVFAASTSTNSAPTANAGSNLTAVPGATVTLDGSKSSDPNGDPLTYAWTQTSGPAVTLSSNTAVRPTFVAPSVTQSTSLTFSLVVSDGQVQSSSASTTVMVATSSTTDVTASGSMIALITSPTGAGSRSMQVIRDGITPAMGSTDSSKQYDTYNGGGARPEDWIGYTFSASQTFNKVVFQEGMQFTDGGWFTSVKVQVRQNGVWVDAPGLTASPAYPNSNNGVSFDTYALSFPDIAGDAIRIDGVPGGASRFISVGELRVWGSGGGGPPPPPPPVSYTSNFDLTESPISEGGKWAVPFAGRNVVTASGIAHGTSSTDGGIDSYAILTGAGAFSPNQSASAVIHFAAGSYGNFCEVAIDLRMAETGAGPRGYEFFISGYGQYASLARWNPARPNGYDLLFATGTFSPAPHDGDTLFASLVGNTATLKLNGTTLYTVNISAFDGNVFSVGNPGISFDENINDVGFGFTSFTATSLQ